MAKTYRGDKGRVAWDGMRAVWDTPLARGGPVGVAEPLAFLPDIKVLVQGGVPQDPRDMAKAGLLEAQSPAVNVRTLRNDAWNRCRVMPRHEP